MSEIRRTIILPFVIWGETWSATFREEPRLWAYENRALRRIFGTKREQTGDNCIVRSFVICMSYKILCM
jgi:hypothetical protein